MPTLVTNDLVMGLGFLLRLTTDPSQHPSSEDFSQCNTMLKMASTEEIQAAASFGGVDISVATELGNKAKTDAFDTELTVVDLPTISIADDLKVEDINDQLTQASDWNEAHPEAEPTPVEWQMLSHELDMENSVPLLEVE